VTYTYKVRNTGTVSLYKVTMVDDKLGTVGTLDKLTSGDRRTFTATATLNETTTNVVVAKGTTSSGKTVCDKDCATVVVWRNPLSVTKTVDKTAVCAGETVTYTYKVTNNGCLPIFSVCLTDDKLGPTGSVCYLCPGASKTFTKSTTLKSTTTNTVTAKGSYFCQSFRAQAQATVTVYSCGLAVEAPKDVTTCSGKTVSCTYKVRNEGSVALTNVIVQDDLVGPIGAPIPTLAPGETKGLTATFAMTQSKTVTVTALGTTPWGETEASDSAHFQATVTAPEAPTFDSVPETNGMVYFSAKGFSGLTPVSGTTLHSSDLTSGAFTGKVYAYEGSIPHFGGSYGPGEMYVYVSQPLLPEDQWNSSSWTNMIGVVDGSNNYQYQVVFSHPLTGTATAYNYKITGVDMAPAALSGPSISSPSLRWVGSGPMPPTPPAGTVAPGWMVQGVASFSLAPTIWSTITVHGSYEDQCGNPYTFSICPPVGGGL
jgi:hypothetical protein